MKSPTFAGEQWIELDNVESTQSIAASSEASEPDAGSRLEVVIVVTACLKKTRRKVGEDLLHTLPVLGAGQPDIPSGGAKIFHIA